MKIFIICSKRFYDRVPDIKLALEAVGHIITLPNCFDEPATEAVYKALGTAEHAVWKAGMIKHSRGVIEANDAVLVLNFEKNGIADYIGGATFLEMYDAFILSKKIFLYNNVPVGMLADEINGFCPVLIHGDISLIV